MLRRFWSWLLNLLGVSASESFDFRQGAAPAQREPSELWRDARYMGRSECANLVGVPFDAPCGFPAEGYFWKQDRGALDGSGRRAYRLYRLSGGWR